MKKRAKKLATAFLAATLAAGMVPQTSVLVKADSEEPYEVVMTYATIGYEPQDLSMVEKALSDLALEKINCTVKFKTVNASDFTSQYNLWASSGEKVDLLVFWGLGLDTYVNEGQIIPLDDYLEYAPAVQKLEEETGFLAGGQYNNQTYAIPAWQSGTGEGRSIYINQELLEGVDYEKKDLYSYEDLEKNWAFSTI